MFKKFFIAFILLGLSTSVLFSSSELFMKKKIQIEDRFRGIGLDPELYKIWIGTRDDANINSKYKIEKKNSGGSKKEYIPGLPTIPSAPKTVSTPSSSYNESYIVYVYIDNSYNTIELKNTMRKIIDTDIWPALNHCDDCIQFEALSFYKKTQGQQTDDNIGLSPETEARFQAAEAAAKELETKLLELQDANVALERTNELNEYALAAQEKESLDQQFIELEEQLALLQTETEEKDVALEEMKSFRLAYLEEQYKMHAMFKDSLLIRYGQKLDNIYDKKEGCLDTRALNFNPNANTDCEGCCRYSEDSPLYSYGCMDTEATNYRPRYTEPCDTCCVYPPGYNKGEGFIGASIVGCMNPEAANFNDRATESAEDMCVFPSNNNWLMYLGIGLLLILIVLSVIAISGGSKKVVYLKPKSGQKSKKEQSNDESESENTDTQEIARRPAMPPTAAPVDEGVLQSEIQTQRQSAVAMSAGQKEGATQILKDWLDESKNDEENSEE